MNYERWLHEATQEIANSNSESPRLDAVLILEFAISKERSYLYSHPENIISNNNIGILAKLVKRRILGEPMAYILGNKEFYGRNFTVTKDVLIPRPDSESIIEFLINHKDKLKGFSLLDVGTGSGCLAITAKLELPNTIIDACDISYKALKVAKKNASLHGANINLFRSNLFINTTKKYDVIIANLPYIPSNFDVSKDVNAEPSIAVYSGDDGLDLTRNFFQQIDKHIKKDGLLIMESLQIQHKKINQLAEAAGLKLIETKDLVQLYNKLS